MELRIYNIKLLLSTPLLSKNRWKHNQQFELLFFMMNLHFGT